METLNHLAPRWPEISGLLDRALSLPAHERDTWLDTLHVEPPALKDTLRELLAAHARVEPSNFLGTLPRLEPLADAPAAADAPSAGDTVGPWRMLRELGQGGMGAVWLAERADGKLKRTVALKLPHLAWGGALAERLARERDILASLTHPHIARLYDAGVDTIGRPWLAIEYVEGRPIDAHCRELGLDTRARVRLLLDVAAAVAYAHSRQVLHRDLKPHNILVTADGQVRLLDFGIAKLMQGDSAAETALTRATGRALTPDYASPEQVRGETLGAASDVYSLGVVAYELLAGAKPYRLKRGSVAELEEAIVSAAVPSASAQADAAVARTLRGDLDAILNQALRKEPERRYASVDAWANDLRRHLAGERVLARPDSLAYRTQRLWRAHATALALGAAALVALAAALGLGATALVIAALAAGLAATLWQARRAVNQARATARHAARADAVQQFLVELLGSAGFGAASAEQRRAITVRQLLERAAKRLRERPSHDPQVQEALLGVVARLFEGLGVQTQAIALHRDLARRMQARGAPALEQARVQAALGDDLVDCDDVPGGIAAYDAALALLGSLTDDSATLARAHVQAKLGRAHFYVGHVEEGTRWIDAAAATPRWRDGDAVMRADLLYSLGSLRAQQGRLDESEAFMREAIAADAIGREALDPVAIDRRVDLARLLAGRRRFADAEREVRLCLALFEGAGEPDHPSVARIVYEFSKQLAFVGRAAEALEMMGRVIEAVEREPLRHAPLQRQRLALGRADLLLDEGRVEDAAAPIAVGADAMCGSSEPLEASEALLTKGRWLADTGRFADALACLERAQHVRTGMFGQTHRLTLTVRNRIAATRMAAGRIDDAMAEIDEVLSVAPPRPAGEAYGSQRDLAEGLRDACRLDQQRHDDALSSTLEHLDRFCALPAGQRPAHAEVTLRLRAARCLIALRRLDEARTELLAIDAELTRLHDRAPIRAAVHAAWALALTQGGDDNAAQARIEEARRVLATQPSLGQQFARAVDEVRGALSMERHSRPSAST